jgi:hypothetical protein
MDHFELIASYPEKEYNEYIERLRKENPNSTYANAIEATRKSNMLIENSSELETEPIDLENKSVYQYQGSSKGKFK